MQSLRAEHFGQVTTRQFGESIKTHMEMYSEYTGTGLARG